MTLYGRRFNVLISSIQRRSNIVCRLRSFVIYTSIIYIPRKQLTSSVSTKHVFSWCFTPGKLGGVLHKDFSHNLQITNFCLSGQKMMWIREILKLFSSFLGCLEDLICSARKIASWQNCVVQ